MVTTCSTVADFEVYQDTDGVFGMFLLKQGAVIEDLSFITRVVLACGTESVDSDSAPAGSIWWTDQGEYLGVTADVLNFKLGIGSLFTDGLKEGCRLTVYDMVNVNGIPYEDNLSINFIPPES